MVPPMTRYRCEYGCLMTPFGRLVVVIMVDTCSGNVWLPSTPRASFTVSVMLNVSATAGVPHTSTCVGLKNEPVGRSNRMSIPGGSPAAVHVNGAMPPDCTLKVRLHGTPMVQSAIRLLKVVTCGKTAIGPSTFTVK